MLLGRYCRGDLDAHELVARPKLDASSLFVEPRHPVIADAFEYRDHGGLAVLLGEETSKGLIGAPHFALRLEVDLDRDRHQPIAPEKGASVILAHALGFQPHG